MIYKKNAGPLNFLFMFIIRIINVFYAPDTTVLFQRYIVIDKLFT